MKPGTNRTIQSEATTSGFSDWTLEPVDGNSLDDLAFVRSIVKTLLDKGEVAPALNLMVAARGIVEQAFDESISNGILLGPVAVRKLAQQLIEIVCDSLKHVAAESDDDHACILDLASDRIKKIF